MIARKSVIPVLFSLICIFLLAGCAGTTSSIPESTNSDNLEAMKAKEEVLLLLGEPKERRNIGELNEEWIYYNVKKSLLDDPQTLSQQKSKRRPDEYSVIRVTFGPLRGWAPGNWWIDLRKRLGVPEKALEKVNEVP